MNAHGLACRLPAVGLLLLSAATLALAQGIDAGDVGSIPREATGIECPEGAMPEGEPVCHDEYVDEYNSGCGALQPPFPFTELFCGQTLCGEGGTFVLNGSQMRDTDWYVLVQPVGATRFTLTGVAEFPIMFALIEEHGELGECDFEIAIADLADPMEQITIEVTDPPFYTYYPWVGATIFEGVPCGAEYVLTVTCTGGCIGDLNDDGVVDVQDLLALLNAWGETGGPADLDGSGTVDVADLLMLLDAWGECL